MLIFMAMNPPCRAWGKVGPPPEKVVFSALTHESAHSNTHHDVQRLASTTVALRQWNTKHSL